MHVRACVILLCFALGLRAAAPTAYALRNARVVTVSGPVLERGTVLWRNGLIEAVGENISVPADAWTVEAQGLTVYPGLIDALSTWGIQETPAPVTPPPAAVPTTTRSRSATPTQPPSSSIIRGPEDRPSNSSWVHAANLISISDRRIEEARSAGFTSAVSFPTTGIFAGQGAVINLAGEKPGEMVVASPAGLYVSLSTRGFTTFPGSLMGVLAYVRQMYLDAEHYRLAKAAYEQHAAGAQRPAYDRAVEGVLEAPRVLLPAQRAYELERMVRFASELKSKTVLYGAHEGYRAAEVLRASGVPVLVSLKWPERSRDADPDLQETLRTLELRDRAPSTPAALAKAGVRFAFYSDGMPNPRDVVRAVKRAIDAGLSQSDAVRAMTLGAAEIYGVADRLGSIEKGKIANLLIMQGDLFQDKTQVKYVFIDGRQFRPTAETRQQEEAAR